MKNKKTLRFLALLLCLTLAASCMPAFAEGAYPIVTEKVTYTMATPYDKDYSTHPPFNILEEITGIHMDVTYYPDWAQGVNLAIAGDTLPDMIFSVASGGDAALREAGRQGKLVNLVDYMQYMPNLQALMDKYPVANVAVTENDGAMYVTPYFLVTAGTYAGNGLYYNRAQAAELGYSDDAMPTTIDGLYELLVKAQETFGKDNPNYYAFRGTNDPAKFAMDVLYGAFGSEAVINPVTVADYGIANPEHKVEYTFTSDQYKRYLEFISKLYAAGCIDPNQYTTNETTNNVAMQEGNGFCMSLCTGGWADDVVFNPDGSYIYGCMDPFSSEYGDGKVGSVYGIPGTSATCLNAKLAEEDRVNLCKWLDCLYSTEENEIAEGISGLMLFQGVRGKDYTVNEDGSYSIFYENAGDIGFLISLYCVFPYMADDQGSNRGQHLWHYNRIRITEQYGVPVENNFPSKYLVYTDEEQDVRNMYEAEIKSFKDEASVKFVTGEWDFEGDWDRYVEQIEAMGIEEIKAVYQAAYDRYQEKLNQFIK